MPDLDPNDTPLPPPVPAATVVVVRDGDAGALEVLLLRRREGGTFSGMWVFPGGRVDPGDIDPDRPADDQAAARRAAVREAVEEAGIVLDPGTLLPYAHWSPPPIQPKRFATWFFLAPDSGFEVTVDGHEIHEHDWVPPSVALERFASGTIGLAPPTFVTLVQLARHGSVTDALAATSATVPPVFSSRPALASGQRVLLWAGDVAYDGGDPDGPGPRHRVWMDEGAWRYEQHDG